MLASSSVDSYYRAALQSLHALMELNPSLLATIDRDELLRVAAAHWRAVLTSAQREPNEFELAILLFPLSTTPGDIVARFLDAIAHTDRPPATWLGALARILRRNRASNDQVILPTVPGANIEKTMLAETADLDSQWNQAFRLHSYLATDDTLVAA
jgi:hypothetical protein